MNHIFAYQSPTRISFGPGVSREAGSAFAAMGARRILAVSGPGPTAVSAGFREVLASLEAAGLAWVGFPRASSDPGVGLVDAGERLYRDEGCDAILAYGGGSPIDCAKGIAATFAEGRSIADFMGTGKVLSAATPPLIAVPTTAGTGSEVTNAAVFILEREGKRKKMGVSGAGLFPRLALVDPGLHVGMPASLTAATGMDALTHAVEAYVSKFHNPISDMYCLEAVRLIGLHLRGAVADGTDAEARSGMALASTLAGVALTQAGLGMVHGFAHPVGALTGTAHGLANAILLPFVMRACAPDASGRLAAIGRALEGRSGGDSTCSYSAAALAAVAALARLGTDIGIPANLGAAGVPESTLPAILADAITYRRRKASPHDFSDEELGALLREAWGSSVG
ncbi:MAG: iron-containing alcohol dehydrogenase [Rectinemataceae bacterium]